jgi:hypothetical protein
MKITSIGSDYIEIDEDNIYDDDLLSINRVHLIKLNFLRPSKQKIERVLDLYPKTNRFVIENDIRIYNGVLRSTSKKYYVSNPVNVNLISFFRKNNKILINFDNLQPYERRFLLENSVFVDLIKNVEVIMMNESLFDSKKEVLYDWNGNVIII